MLAKTYQVKSSESHEILGISVLSEIKLNGQIIVFSCVSWIS